MEDSFERKINYVRVSVTDRCNLRCRYCMPHDLETVSHEEILRYEEILKIVEVMSELGIETVKITGGEPLVRHGVTGLIEQIKALEKIKNVTLTTNGVLLAKYIGELCKAGISAVNISLDTLDAKGYETLTGKDKLADVLKGIDYALKNGIKVKINCVPIKGYNESELLSMAQLAERAIDVRFIEVMPMGFAKNFDGVKGDKILETLKNKYSDLHLTEEKRGFGPSVYYGSKDLVGRIGFINAMSHEFCDKCNRVRLTSEGRLKLCLYHDKGVDLKALLRGGASKAELKYAVETAILSKPEKHDFEAGKAPGEGKNMSQIGG